MTQGGPPPPGAAYPGHGAAAAYPPPPQGYPGYPPSGAPAGYAPHHADPAAGYTQGTPQPQPYPHHGSPASPASPFTPGPMSPATPLDAQIAAPNSARGKTLRAAGQKIAGGISAGANWAQTKVDTYADNKMANTPHHGDAPKQVSGAHMTAARGGAKFAGVVAQATGLAVGAFSTAAGAVGRAVVPKPGENPGAIRSYATAAVGAVVDVSNAAKVGAKGVVGTGADRAQEYMHHAHGPQRAELVGHYGQFAKHGTSAALNVSDITPAGFVKKAAVAGLGQGRAGAPGAIATPGIPGSPGPMMSPHGAPAGYHSGPPGGYYAPPPPGAGAPPPAAQYGGGPPPGYPPHH